MRRRTVGALVALVILGAGSAPTSVVAQTNAPPPATHLSSEEALRIPQETVQSMTNDAYTDWLTVVVAAAKQGNAEAQYRFGRELARAEKYQDAVGWLTKAATQGHVLAQTILGNFYLTGDQIPKDYAKALMWNTKAAEQGNVDAQVSLGYMYEEGFGVAKDRDAAISWLKKAAAQGDADAKKELRRLQGQASPIKRRDIPDALVFRCQLESSRSIGQAMKSETDADAQAAHKAYEACLRSNWKRLFGDVPFPED
jgi:TPR repeat protein